jgi:hypothetical protein
MADTLDLGGNDLIGVGGMTLDAAVDLDFNTGNIVGLDQIDMTGDINMGGRLNHDGSHVGFYGKAPVTRPEVPAIPLAQDVVDALVALGLITQAP